MSVLYDVVGLTYDVVGLTYDVVGRQESRWGLQLFRRPRRAAQAGSAESRPELTGASCIDTITATMA